jgi:nucleotidyltransferase substrate binding protein (TIGR01987 family)
MAYFILDSIDISSLLKAYATFDEAINVAKTTLEQDGAIQRFEYTYELFWKILKKVLEVKGKICNSPRDVFREAALQGLIDDPIFWFEVIKKRNLTVHNYERKIADSIYSSLPSIRDNMLQVITRIQTL